MADKKTLVIRHDGQITVSHFVPLSLGDVPLHNLVAEALELADGDYKRIDATVTVVVKLKNDKPIVYWEEED